MQYNIKGIQLKEEQYRLIMDCWTSCNRIGAMSDHNINNMRVLEEGARVSEKNITEDLVSDLPRKIVELIKSNFSDDHKFTMLENVKYFFSESNKDKNIIEFIEMLNRLNGFKGIDFVIIGTIIVKRPFKDRYVPTVTMEYIA